MLPKILRLSQLQNTDGLTGAFSVAERTGSANQLQNTDGLAGAFSAAERTGSANRWQGRLLYLYGFSVWYVTQPVLVGTY